MKNLDYYFEKLGKSKFRSSFHLKEKDKLYVKEKGLGKIKNDTMYFIENRLAADYPKNDGKQTPMRGHPSFIAFHATATCCRGCMNKWYRIPKGRELKEDEKEFICELVMEYIKREMENDI